MRPVLKELPQRRVFREDVRNVIREAIFSNELQPGERILEAHWSNRLGVSQGPVREALRDLEALGLVEATPFKGSRVRKLSRKDIEDNYSVRLCLEVQSMKNAISCLNLKQHQALCIQLHQALAQMEQAVEKEDLRGFVEGDTFFHASIIHATGNGVLLKLWEQSNIRNWNMIPAHSLAESLRVLHTEHTKLMTAISQRDVQRVESIMDGELFHIASKLIQGVEAGYHEECGRLESFFT